jgi:5-methyltetrahydropteroyltriglutamate--homocysteine methyltransferase
MNRNKLAALGVNLPVLPATSVGSLPKSKELLAARKGFAQGKIDYESLKQLEIKTTEFWIKKQDEIGLDVIVDGEMYRGDMAAYFAETLQGFQTGELVRSYGNRYYRKPVITGEVKWCSPITTEWWSYAQSLTEKPVKGMLTGPYTIMDWSFNEFYPDRRSAALAIARELRKEVEALVDAGAKIIQVDEPAISTRIDELDFAREAMQLVTAGINAYFICHICYGNFLPVYRHLLSLDVDNLDLETSMKTDGLEAYLRNNSFDKDISYGVFDVHNHKIESVPELEDNIRRALSMFDKEQIWIGPDCGLKTRSVEEAAAKLTNMVAAVSHIREQI